MTESRAIQLFIDLAAPELDLALAGAKGANLGRLLRAGFHVPPGFVVTTLAYQQFVDANHLQPAIAAALADVDHESTAALDQASERIRHQFTQGSLPAAIAKGLLQAYQQMGEPAVAVRSSATAEDLPEASFAGQQDTLLNVVGSEELVRAVIHCWSSLWTARAIAYRARHGFDHEALALAVVVQRMIESHASGVLFTANPLTGQRDQTVIDATLGLGEALVSGQVEPDHYVLTDDGTAVEVSIGAKATVVRSRSGGGTVTEVVKGAPEPALAEDQLVDLVRLGRQVEAQLGQPQDIEWAIAGDELFLLQSRPITTLYPLPAGLPSRPLRALFSFGAVQGLLDPITPLGRDVVINGVAGGARLFGVKRSRRDLSLVRSAGQRLWLDLTSTLRNRLGRRLARGGLTYVEPGSQQAVVRLLEDGEFDPPGYPRLGTVLRALRPLPGVIIGVLRTLANPDRSRRAFEDWLDQWLAAVGASLERADNFNEQIALFQQASSAVFALLVPRFVSRFAPSMLGYNLLIHLAESLPADVADPPIDTRLMLRGLPHNVTTEMDLKLWQTAQTIAHDQESRQMLLDQEPVEVAQAYQQEQLPPVAQGALEAFLAGYGMRGLGEIDIGRPRWSEDPTPLVQALRSYLQIDDPKLSPELVYARGKAAAEVEMKRLVQALRTTPGGALKARVARWASRRMRGLMGMRESPKFGIIRLFWLFRKALLAHGSLLVEAGSLDQRDDLFFLTLDELGALSAGSSNDWRALIQRRRASYQRERARRRVPRLLLSDGRAFYEGMLDQEPGGEHLWGSPVSPGMVEGRVRLVLDPRGAALEPGEILVCPGTDPSWTPLFLVAGGLVMEVGGMMTHGAVVAREYGIPAVVGVHDATQRLTTGQRVRVDGSSGRVTVLGPQTADG